MTRSASEEITRMPQVVADRERSAKSCAAFADKDGRWDWFPRWAHCMQVI